MANSGAVIWMHGLGDRGASWSGLPRELEGDFKGVNWQFPDAPILPVTCNGGAPCPSWFDLQAIPVGEAEPDDEVNLNKAVATIHALVDEQVAAGVQPSRIFLGGFSQGGAISLLAGLQYKERLGGIISCSGWLPMREKVQLNDNSRQTPVLLAHGDADQVVLYSLAKVAADKLKEGGSTSVVQKTYPRLQHSTCGEEMQDVSQFLMSVFN